MENQEKVDILIDNAVAIIAQSLNINESDISDVVVLKKGMTNRSCSFVVDDKRYIARIPGEGTSSIINRRNEASVYSAIADKGLCDNVVYINPDTGVKITEYIEDSRVCDTSSDEDLINCMKRLKEFHNMKLKVDHDFDLKGQINYYESLRGNVEPVFSDYEITKNNVMSLFDYIDSFNINKQLCHIDSVPDNFLFDADGNIRLIDWEYAGMQDPHVDIAMFCIYSLFDRDKSDRLMDIYFEGNCPEDIRVKIYCYMAICGLLWSNWCEYKHILGVEFGDYFAKQYAYAKDFYVIAKDGIERLSHNEE